MILKISVIALAAQLFVSQPTAQSAVPNVLYPMKLVAVKPAYGIPSRTFRAYISKSEVDIVRRLQLIAVEPYPILAIPLPPPELIVEPGIENSKTFNLASLALRSSETLLGHRRGSYEFKSHFIIGRTQKWIKEQVAKLGCVVDLSRTGGVFLMGSTICNQTIVVINLTGYFFITSAGQKITSALEARAEPLFSKTDYRIISRNISSMAHEWVHIARNGISSGFSAGNEPAWLREGMAEIISGLAMVRASVGFNNYLKFHVIRFHKFSNIARSCPNPLSTYRRSTFLLSNCEYLLGGLAVELLIANYGGLDKLISLYDDVHETNDFNRSFINIYGMSIRSFESRADKYSRYVAIAANRRLP